MKFKVGDKVRDIKSDRHGTVEAVLDAGYEVLMDRPKELWYFAEESLALKMCKS